MKFETYTSLGAVSHNHGPWCPEDGSAFETRCATGISKVFKKVFNRDEPTGRWNVATNSSVKIANTKFER